MRRSKKEPDGQQVPPIKPWAEMTDTDIIRLKRQQCIKCVYYSQGCSSAQSTGTCEYIKIEGHMRGCSPLECKEKGIFKPKEGRNDGKRKI